MKAIKIFFCISIIITLLPSRLMPVRAHHTGHVDT